MKTFSIALESRRKSWITTLPPHVPVDRFIKSAMIAIVKNPKLLRCTESSVFQCLNTAANIGLDVSGELNSSHLIPYGDKCTLVIGYRDLIGLARRSGQISKINMFAIHEGDEVTVFYGTDAKIEHKPAWKQPGAFLGVYATASLTGGEFVFTPIMSKAEVEKIRDGSSGYKAAKQYNKPSPWTDHFEEMAKKTALRRLFKILPVAIDDVAKALEADDNPNAAAITSGSLTKGDGTIDVEGFAKMVDDAESASDDQGTPGAVDAAIEAAETASQREPGVDEPEGTPPEPTNPFTAAAEPAKPKESFGDVAKRAAAKAGGA